MTGWKLLEALSNLTDAQKREEIYVWDGKTIEPSYTKKLIINEKSGEVYLKIDNDWKD